MLRNIHSVPFLLKSSETVQVFHRRVRSTMSSAIENIDIVKPSTEKHSGTVIFLHGSGGTGILLKAWVQMLCTNVSFPHLKIMYPTAPVRPYTPLGGESSNVWFDRVQIAPNCPEHLETIDPMAQELVKLIDEELQSGIPLNRIVVGGFSMGGSMALHLGYRFMPGVAGVFSLSSFLNDNSIVYKELKEKKLEKPPPLFHAHGDRDDLVEFSWGRQTFEQLCELGVEGKFLTVPNAFHELKGRELRALFEWIQEIVPND